MLRLHVPMTLLVNPCFVQTSEVVLPKLLVFQWSTMTDRGGRAKSPLRDPEADRHNENQEKPKDLVALKAQARSLWMQFKHS